MKKVRLSLRQAFYGSCKIYSFLLSSGPSLLSSFNAFFTIGATYDWPSLSGSYINSERTAKRLLEQNPSIRFVFDVHRDANVPDRVVMVDGKRVARVLLIDRKSVV